MREGWIGGVFAVFTGLGIVATIELSLDSSESGFFLKPLFAPSPSASPLHESSLFVLNNPKNPVKVHADYGPFSAEDIVPMSVLQSTVGNQSNLLANIAVDDVDISAHLVTRSLMQDRPYVQVLFHASQLTVGDTTPVPDPHDTQRWCLQMHVVRGGGSSSRDDTELTSVCVVGRQNNVCMSELTLPYDWWGLSHVHSVGVFFSVYSVSTNLQCSSAPQGDSPGWPIRSYVGTVTLAHGELMYQQVAEDQHILLYIPQKSFYPGSKFRIPVKLQAESDLEVFVVRVKARHGFKLIGAEPSNTEKWRISLNVNQKKHGAMVTAFVRNKKTYTKTDRIQPVFDWIFEVDDGADLVDSGRIILNLEYEMNSKMEETYGSVTNRVVARVQVQHDNILTIVPVIKSTKLVNTAILTGQRQSYPMKIYSLGQGGRVVDITASTTCHSGDESVLKVTEQCDTVYLDGTEVKGSPSVSVIVKHGRHTKFLFFKVWVPEIPLVIELSDNKLTQIKGWKAPKHQSSVRNRRDADFSADISHPALTLDDSFAAYEDDYDDGGEDDDFATSCHLKYQQGIVDVYAHFYVPDETRSQYLVHRKAAFRITDLVRDRLRIADSRIAALSENVVEGLRPGRTEVQVLSQIGRVIGATEVRVGSNKVGIQELQVTVVTGITVETSADVELPGTMVAHVTKQSQLHRKYQEGVIDINILFDDGASMPLRHVPPSDYFLDMDTLNNHVVAFGPMIRPDTPRVIALGTGKGELLKIALELGDACQRKKSRPLAISYPYIDVDFEKHFEEELQNDGHFGYGESGYLVPDTDVMAKGGKDTSQKRWENDLHADSYGAGILPSGAEPLSPSHEAQQQPVGDDHPLTALEIGMYVLLGIFCLAIAVFLGNCMIFVVRHRRKGKPYEASETVANANDWVWIGRATLERNAINTGCAQRLMPEQDFSVGVQNLLPPGSTHTVPVVRHSNAQSNRNSLVSTYKGSECSIRITSNPLNAEANTSNRNSGSSGNSGNSGAAAAAASSGAAAAPPAYDTLPKSSAVDNMNNAPAPPVPAHAPKLPPPIPSHAAKPPPVPSQAPEKPLPEIPRHSAPPQNPPPPIPESSSDEEMMSLPSQASSLQHPHGSSQQPSGSLQHPGSLQQPSGSLQHPMPRGGFQAADACNNNMAAPGGNMAAGGGALSDVEWDYEAMGMTYEQLMQYFDNLKESSA